MTCKARLKQRLRSSATSDNVNNAVDRWVKTQSDLNQASAVLAPDRAFHIREG